MKIINMKNIQKLSKEVKAADIKLTKAFKKLKLAQDYYNKCGEEYDDLYRKYHDEYNKLPVHN